jgi:hypothetical protein
MRTVAKAVLPIFGFGLRHRLEGAEMALRAALAERDEYLRRLNTALAERDELQRQRDYFRGELELSSASGCASPPTRILRPIGSS